MNRNLVLILIAAAVCLSAGCCGLIGLGGFATFKGVQQAGSNISSELTPVLTPILTQMDSEALRSVMTAEAQKDEPADVTAKYFQDCTRDFGKLKSLGEGTLSNISTNSVNGDTRQEVTIKFNASFEKAEGDVEVEAVKHNKDGWKVIRLRISPTR